jgi:hypothetical protein
MTPERVEKTMRWVMILIAQFLVLTFLAMPLYSGGNDLDPTAPGYSFSRNFFSTLGLTVAYGRPNTASAVLFFIAMAGGGLGLALFTLAFPSFFQDSFIARWASRIGSLFGIVSGLFFIGVAFTPANLATNLHIFFVMWAFQLFPIGVIFYIVAILRQQDYPNRHAILFGLFAVALFGYVWLLNNGPGTGTASGLVIQAVGQKAIAYLSLPTIFYQAWVTRKMAAGRAGAAKLQPRGGSR